MPLVFVGGARASGKTTLIKAMQEKFPHIQHVILAREVTRILPVDEFQSDYVGMRRLTPNQQYEAVSEVVKVFANYVQNNPSQLVFIDGHYVSSSYIDNHESYIPAIRDNAHLFSKLIWLKTDPYVIFRRKYVRDKIRHPLYLIVREYLAECLEAKLLQQEYSVELITCLEGDFYSTIYANFSEFLKKPPESDIGLIC